jgi:hypothetical protein
VSSAAREPLPGDSLPAVQANSITVREAAPNPAPGPQRDQLAALSDARARANEAIMAGVVTAFLDRTIAVILARLNGPRARRGTKFWAGSNAGTRPLDAEYIVPDRTISELEPAVIPAARRILSASVDDVAGRLDHAAAGTTLFDATAMASAAAGAAERIRQSAEHYAATMREIINAASVEADTLDQVVEMVRAQHRKGGNWLLLNGRTLATALAGDAALAAARALGVTHTQWITKHDDRVRITHRAADGQVRRIGDRFRVGGVRLMHPADPSVLPGGAEEVYGCRCGLLFDKPDATVAASITTADIGTAPAAKALSAGADRPGALAHALPTESLPGVPTLAGAVDLGTDVAGYRLLTEQLDVVPGQLLTLPGPLTLGLAKPLAKPVSTVAALLIVVATAGTMVGVTAGTMTLVQDTPLMVVSATDGVVVAIPVSSESPPQ